MALLMTLITSLPHPNGLCPFRILSETPLIPTTETGHVDEGTKRSTYVMYKTYFI